MDRSGRTGARERPLLRTGLDDRLWVPSVAIKEGVYKSLQITEEHFKRLYAGVPFDYFLYDSAKLGQVRNFATSPQTQIMVVDPIRALGSGRVRGRARGDRDDEGLATRERRFGKGARGRREEGDGGEHEEDDCSADSVAHAGGCRLAWAWAEPQRDGCGFRKTERTFVMWKYQ